jgi:hypothetical protein
VRDRFAGFSVARAASPVVRVFTHIGRRPIGESGALLAAAESLRDGFRGCAASV